MANVPTSRMQSRVYSIALAGGAFIGAALDKAQSSVCRFLPLICAVQPASPSDWIGNCCMGLSRAKAQPAHARSPVLRYDGGGQTLTVKQTFVILNKDWSRVSMPAVPDFFLTLPRVLKMTPLSQTILPKFSACCSSRGALLSQTIFVSNTIRAA